MSTQTGTQTQAQTPQQIRAAKDRARRQQQAKAKAAQNQPGFPPQSEGAGIPYGTPQGDHSTLDRMITAFLGQPQNRNVSLGQAGILYDFMAWSSRRSGTPAKTMNAAGGTH